MQKFLPNIKHGDKRIILVDGEYAGAVNRIPAADDLRSNMVRGGAPSATELTKREADICKRIGPALRERGLLFVGIDVIDGYLTEINVTSPTGIRAIKNLGGPDVAAMIWDKIEAKRVHEAAHQLMSVALTIATTDYDHFRDFRLGSVRAEGIDVNWLTLGHHEIFSRFTFNREWDVSELSFAKFMAQVTRKDSDIIGLPVYASRLFRFASFYVNRKAGIKTAKDLRGKRIGVPEWAHTAAVYMRGWLMHEEGVALSDVDWVQAGTNEAGRMEKVELSLPEGVRLTRMPEKTLSGMIASGEIDCVIIARPPNSFREGSIPTLCACFPITKLSSSDTTSRPASIRSCTLLRSARLFSMASPGLHAISTMRSRNQKRRSLERILDPAVSRYPVPWLTSYALRMQQMFGGDLFPYGIEANRPTLELFLRYAHEQGIAHRLAKPEEIFPAGIMASAKI